MKLIRLNEQSLACMFPSYLAHDFHSGIYMPVIMRYTYCVPM